MNPVDDRGQARTPSGPPDHPRSEPEIIPPQRGDHGTSRSHVWIWVTDRDGVRRSSVSVPGPFTIFLALALIALVTAVIVAVVLGAVLLWIPILILLIGAALVTAAVRRRWGQFQRWLLRR